MGVIIGAVVALGTLIWAITRVMEGMSDAKFAARRFSWTRKAKRNVKDLITDPREAAAVLLLQMASYDGGEAAAARAQTALADDIARDEVEAGELMTFAGLILKDAGDASNAMRKYTSPINDACSRAQKEGLLSALEFVAGADDVPPVQAQFLQSARRLLLND